MDTETPGGLADSKLGDTAEASIRLRSVSPWWSEMREGIVADATASISCAHSALLIAQGRLEDLEKAVDESARRIAFLNALFGETGQTEWKAAVWQVSVFGRRQIKR